MSFSFDRNPTSGIGSASPVASCCPSTRFSRLLLCLPPAATVSRPAQEHLSIQVSCCPKFLAAFVLEYHICVMTTPSSTWLYLITFNMDYVRDQPGSLPTMRSPLGGWHDTSKKICVLFLLLPFPLHPSVLTWPGLPVHIHPPPPDNKCKM